MVPAFFIFKPFYYLTVTLHEAFLLPIFTVITAFPFFLAIIFPLLSTDTTPFFDDFHFILSVVLTLSWDVMISLCHADMRLPG